MLLGELLVLDVTILTSPEVISPEDIILLFDIYIKLFSASSLNRGLVSANLSIVL